MVKVIKIDDFGSSETASKTISLKQVETIMATLNTVLNSPVVNLIIGRIASRFGLQGGGNPNPRPPDFTKSEIKSVDEHKVYLLIKNSLKNLIDMGMGENKLSEFNDYVCKNEQEIKELIKVQSAKV